MIKGFCDSCNEEIKEKIGSGGFMYFRQVFKPQGQALVPIVEQAQIDLCSKCGQKVLDALNVKPKENEPTIITQKGLGGDSAATGEGRVQQPRV